MKGELVLLYRKVEGKRMVLQRCGCGTLTPRPGGMCGDCLAAQAALQEISEVLEGLPNVAQG